MQDLDLVVLVDRGCEKYFMRLVLRFYQVPEFECSSLSKMMWRKVYIK